MEQLIAYEAANAVREIQPEEKREEWMTQLPAVGGTGLGESHHINGYSDITGVQGRTPPKLF